MLTPQATPPSSAETLIRETIRRESRITFARFMELALFSPGGYYPSVRAQEGGRLKDFFTSPAAHPSFGWLLALQLDEVWERLGRPDPFWVVELGAGDGLLAHDILDGMEKLQLPSRKAARYVASDRTAPVSRLEAGFPHAGRLFIEGTPLRNVVGCILSNELPDAFPVHRFAVRGDEILETYVTLSGEKFTEVLDTSSTQALSKRVRPLVERGVLGDGSRGEVCLALDGWIADVAGALKQGVVLTVDYGDTTEALYGSPRRGGTLRCYYRHTVGGNPYVRVGRQDITAHVDFGALARLGEQAGLRTLGYATQRRFLGALGADLLVSHTESQQLPSQQARANMAALEEILSPEGLGNFKVLAQGKDVGTSPLSGFLPDSPARGRLAAALKAAPAPLLTLRHMQPPDPHLQRGLRHQRKRYGGCGLRREMKHRQQYY